MAVMVFPFGIHREPALLNPFLLREEFTDTPESGSSEHAQERREIDVDGKQRRQATAYANEQIDNPRTGAPVILCLDNKRMPNAYGKKGHRSDDNACEVHVMFCEFGCKGTSKRAKIQIIWKFSNLIVPFNLLCSLEITTSRHKKE